MSDLKDKSSSFDCEFRPNKRNRRIKLSYQNERGFLVTYPPRTALKTVKKFVSENEDWMRSVVARALETAPSTTLREYLEHKRFLSLNGVHKEVIFQSAGGLMTEFTEVILFYPEISENQLKRKLQELSKKYLIEMLFRNAEVLNLELKKGQVRDQKSRWGSCSSSKSINLNWRLILMPASLQQHIILHELAHLVHPNHSDRFWKLLKSWDTDFDKNEADLKAHGSKWIRLGRN